LIHPLTVLKDSAQSFGAYTPENADGRFVGPLIATEALNRSRNVPAIALAAKLGKPGLYDFLRSAGVGGLAPESHYGLALVLGGGEITMEELVQMYAMLANQGESRPLRTLASEKPAKGNRLLSEEAAFIVLDMLSQNPRPDTGVSSGIPAGLPVHWKTGTSTGFRDAWTVGIFGPYVLAVWLGNFDNNPNPALLGIQMAAPLFFELINSINTAQPGLHSRLLQQPPNLSRVEVCAASGDLPNADCPQRAQAWFIPGKSPIRVSTLHRRLAIDNATGLIACPPYKPGRTHTEVFEYWPSDMMAIFQQAGLPRRMPPARSPSCANAGDDSGTPPQITEPLRAVTYTLRLSKTDEQTIPLHATVDASANEVYWFAGEQYLGKAPRGRTLPWQPINPGHYVLRAVDDAGRSDSRDVTISIAQ
jgi:penicillin-binding protein 1C